LFHLGLLIWLWLLLGGLSVGATLVLGVYTIIKCRNSRRLELTEPDRKKKIPRAKLLYYRGPRFYLTRHEYTEAKNAELVGRRTIERRKPTGITMPLCEVRVFILPFSLFKSFNSVFGLHSLLQ
jgi:hypothetical protein